MATDTDHHQTYTNDWSLPHLPSQHQDPPQAVSISQILDHGSISFGRFAAESLAWEKWSVFSHNRHQEELEKFKAPGLVAQKKAYFEEYYKKVRAMKALQAEQQGTAQSSPLQDEWDTSTSVENSVDVTMSKEENKTSNVGQFQFSDTVTTSYPDSWGGSIGHKSEEITEQQREYCDNHNEKISTKDEIDSSLSTIQSDHSTKEVGPESASSINTSSDSSLQDNLVSNAVNITNKPEDHAPVLKAKGTVASAKNKTKLDCRTKKDSVEPSKKLKQSFRKEITGKADNSLVSNKRATPRAASNMKSNSVSSHRPLTEVRASVTALHASFVRDKVVSSPCTIKGGQTKAILNSKNLANKFPTRLQIHAQGHLSVQSTSKEITVTGGVKNIALENRRSQNKSMNLPAQNRSNQNIGIEFGRKSNVRGKQKEGKGEIKTGLGRDPKSASSIRSSISKAPNPKPEHKIASSRSADLRHDRREPSRTMPSWR